MDYRVLVCGGRDYHTIEKVFEALEVIWKNSIGDLVIIEGGAPGADRAARLWAQAHVEFGVRLRSFPANWSEFGKSAGPIRNKQMLDEGKPHLCVWFPGGKGTKNMMSLARVAGVPVVPGEVLDEIREVLI